MKRIEGVGPAVLLLLLPLGLLLPASAAAGLSGAGLPTVDARTPTMEDRLVSLDAAAHTQSNTSMVSGDAFEPPLLREPKTGSVRAAGRAVESGEAKPVTIAAATGAAIGLGILTYFALPFFSRIDGHRILDNGMRQRVHEAIEHNPGITIKEIVQTLGIGWGTAVYHLKRLESERLIVSERHRQFRRYFKNGGGIANQDKGAFSELKNPTTLRLASELLQRPGSAQKDLCAAAGISAPLASKYLGRMEEAALLTRQREWKTVKYFPTPRLAELLRPTPSAPQLVLAAA